MRVAKPKSLEERLQALLPSAHQERAAVDYTIQEALEVVRSSEAVERDAARYRWLRGNWEAFVRRLPYEGELETAIDAAMSSAPEGKG